MQKEEQEETGVCFGKEHDQEDDLHNEETINEELCSWTSKQP
jgi:hypothetical protein